MKFNFPLESILSYRRRVEDREWICLQSIGQRLNAARNDLENARRAYDHLIQANRDELRRGATGVELQYMRDCESALQEKCVALMRSVEQIECEHKAQYSIFLRERLKRETLSTLREQRYEAHVLEAQRREQEQVDALFLVKLSSPPS